MDEDERRTRSAALVGEGAWRRSVRPCGLRRATDILYKSAQSVDELENGSWRRRSSGRRAGRCRSWPSATCGCTSRRMGAYEEREIPIIVRGEGCYVFDEHGNRYLDGLSALFCVNIGHGRAEVAQAGADQAKELGFFTNWSYAHPNGDRARRARRRARARRPEPRLLHLRRHRGRRLGAQALPPVPQAHRQRRAATRSIARKIAYHGTTMGALTATGIPSRATPFEPLFPGSATCPTRTRTGREVGRPGRGDPRADPLRGARDRLVRDPRAGAELRRLLRPARRLLRSACARSATSSASCSSPTRSSARGAGSASTSAPSARLPARPHHHRQGPDVRLRPDGRRDRLRPGLRAVRRTARDSFIARHHVRRAPGRGRGRAGQPRRLRGRGPQRARARQRGRVPRRCSTSLRDIPIVGDVRGAGYFQAIELVRDQATKEHFSERGVRVAAARLPLAPSCSGAG